MLTTSQYLLVAGLPNWLLARDSTSPSLCFSGQVPIIAEAAKCSSAVVTAKCASLLPVSWLSAIDLIAVYKSGMSYGD